jgi:hypothetical protein
MPLTWNAEKVPADVREREGALMEAAIWNSMAIGVPELTPRTIEKAIERTRAIEEKGGAYVWGGEDALTPLYLWQSLPQFMGLRTNASRMTDAAFRRHLAAL